MENEEGNITEAFCLTNRKIMLEHADQKRPSLHFGAKMLVVRGRRFKNSAAKFWSALTDELLAEYDNCRRVVLEAVNEGQLDPALLFPELELEREVNLFSNNTDNINEVWRKALAEYELYGPPGSVGMRIYSPAGEQKRLSLPLDCVDAEIFLYLLAWLLEWSDLPLSAWNEPRVKGSFSAADPFRKFKYSFDFDIEHTPLKEGLFTWKLELQFKRHSSLPEQKITTGHGKNAALTTGLKNDTRRTHSPGT